MMITLFSSNIHCLFKETFGIACPTCGFTRAFIALLHGHILTSLRYNILCIPFLLFWLYYIAVIIYCWFRKTDDYIISLENKIIILLLILNMIINNI